MRATDSDLDLMTLIKEIRCIKKRSFIRAKVINYIIRHYDRSGKYIRVSSWKRKTEIEISHFLVLDMKEKKWVNGYFPSSENY
jgi:hypothetical protein